MNDGEFLLSRDQRDQMINAVNAIERQLKGIGNQPRWQVLYVITTNLTIIQMNLTNLARISPN